MTWPAYMLPSVESSQPGILRIYLIAAFERSVSQDPIHELVREETFSALVGCNPLIEYCLLDAPHRFHFRNARVCHAVHVPVEKVLFVLRRQVSVIGNAL